jgi:hypothetical protein
MYHIQRPEYLVYLYFGNNRINYIYCQLYAFKNEQKCLTQLVNVIQQTHTASINPPICFFMTRENSSMTSENIFDVIR